MTKSLRTGDLDISILPKHNNEIEQILKIVNESCSQVKTSDNRVKEIAERYQLKEEDVVVWFNETEWAYNGDLDINTIN